MTAIPRKHPAPWSDSELKQRLLIRRDRLKASVNHGDKNVNKRRKRLQDVTTRILKIEVNGTD